MADKKYVKAVDSYNKAFSLEKTAVILSRLAQAMRQANQGLKADALLADWVKTHPDDIQIRLNYADAAIKEKNYLLAIEQYQYVVNKQPQNLDVMHNLIWCYQQQNDMTKALAIAEQAYKVNPKATQGIVDLAGMLLTQGDNGRAVQLFEKARDLDPAAPETRFYLAKAYVKVGNKDGARKELKQKILFMDW